MSPGAGGAEHQEFGVHVSIHRDGQEIRKRPSSCRSVLPVELESDSFRLESWPPRASAIATTRGGFVPCESWISEIWVKVVPEEFLTVGKTTT
jgi:hypothetical protein